MAGVFRNPPPRPLARLGRVLCALVLAALVGACAEDLESGSSCATLCPGADIPEREVTLSAITLAQDVPGILATGTEQLLPLIARGDTVQTRVVLRFDRLVTRYRPGTTDTTTRPIDTVADAAILLTLERFRSTLRDTVVIEAFDLEDGTDDTTTAGIEAKLVPSRLIGTRRLLPADIALDTFSIRLDDESLEAKLAEPDSLRRRLRVALRATSPAAVALRIIPTTALGGGPRLRYKQASQTTLIDLLAESRVPAGDAAAAREQADFATLPVPPPVVTGNVLAVGGLPARRTLLRFAIPDSIDEGAAILQAELRLVQLPGPLPDLIDSARVDTSSSGLRPRADTVVVLPLVGVGGAALLDDPVRAAQLALRRVGVDQLSLPALRVTPADSGRQAINVAAILRRWRLLEADEPRYLVLAAESEGVQAATAYFWSTAASDPSLRPVLYIRYIPRVRIGLP